jgi:hypothetical protein
MDSDKKQTNRDHSASFASMYLSQSGAFTNTPSAQSLWKSGLNPTPFVIFEGVALQPDRWER